MTCLDATESEEEESESEDGGKSPNKENADPHLESPGPV